MIYDDKQFIAKKLRLARKNAKLTQAQLAEIVGISPKQLSRIELGNYNPSLPTFLKLAAHLKMDLSELGLDNFKEQSPIRDKILKLIFSSTDSELQFYYEAIETMMRNFKLIRAENFYS